MAHEDRGLFGLEGRALLVLETDAECAAAVSRWLEICGARVATAATLGAAVTQARRQTPELMLVDVSLPNGDDWAIVERLRENVPGGTHVPVVAVTATPGSANGRTARAHGVRQVVERPIAPAALGAALSACLRAPGRFADHRPDERRMRGRRRRENPFTRRRNRVTSGCGPVAR
jgi:CheY-like chemotaxis protein